MKFKVWDSKDKKFVEQEDLHYFCISPSGKLIYFNNWNEQDDLPHDGFIPVFSTGQTDKNGVEVWEGDIRGDKWWKFVICYGTFLVTDSETDYETEQVGFYKKFLSKKNGVEIIEIFDLIQDLNTTHHGNRYENPELLEAK